MIYSVAVAGSTQNTLICAQALVKDQRFKLELVITPKAKARGRKQLFQPNPMESFAQEKNITTFLVDKTIKSSNFDDILSKKFDFLLVVDFGYLLPAELLNQAKVAAVNIHPSALPRWRGSAPAQFVLLNGESSSAVSLIKMDNQLDHGPIITQYPFLVEPNWTQAEYYHFSFDLIAQHLAEDLVKLATSQLHPTLQPDLSPTPLAKKLTKTDSFVAWSIVVKAMEVADKENQAQYLERASRAFSPWPKLWTLLPTVKGEKRMKILKTHLIDKHLVLDQVQIEGQIPAAWNQVRNVVKN